MASYGASPAIQHDVPEKKSSFSTASLPKENQDGPRGDADIDDADVGVDKNTPSTWLTRNHSLVRRVKLFTLAAVILAWWISSTVLQATRHRWIVQTILAWSIIAIVAFRFIPNSVVTRPVEAVWIPLVQEPFFALPKYVRYGMGWLALVAIVIGSAFGFKIENVGLFSFFETRHIYTYICA